ncbi:MAG: FecR domain-containing protein [Verrucomicrobia bacterium]|nr:FecR domain-containing protein [Verrucomicrobiota bacterium]
MSSPSPDSPENTLRATAARWAVRRDRGLSAAESIDYELWFAADPRHAAAMQRTSAAWSLLDRIPESAAAPILAAATRRRSFWRRTVTFGSLAAAAALAVGLFVWSRPLPADPTLSAPALSATTTPRLVTLSDGTVVQLNTGGAVVEEFTADTRHVTLTRGEAHFAVAKNPARPFIVQAGALQVRAVGTAFNIHLQSAAVDVIVTEGRVQLTTGTPDAPALNAGERATLRRAAAGPTLVVARIDAAAITQTLAWREPLMRLGGATLAELAAEFERATGRRLVLADPTLADLRFGGRFRTDDIDGFTHLLATTLDLDVERTADGAIVLRKKN